MGKPPESGDRNAQLDVAETAISRPVRPAARSGETAIFPRSARLLTPGKFTAVFEKRSARRGRFFHLHLGAVVEADAPGNLPAVPRIGIAVPKKLLKTAVHRNLVKRIARETFRGQRTVLIARDYVLRLSVKLDPKKQPLDRTALAADVAALLKGQSVPTPSRSAVSSDTGAGDIGNGAIK